MKRASLCLLLWSLTAGAFAAAPLVTVPRTATAPVIDGRLDDGCWALAAQVSGFVLAGKGLLTRHPVTARLLYDDRALYVGFVTAYDVPTKPRAEARPRDGGVWQDDAVEVLLDPGQTGTGFYQFIVNAVGSLYDARGTDTTFNTDMQAKTTAADRSWTAEVAIPFAAFGNAPKMGDKWGANFAADALSADNELSSWANTGSTYATPDRFGTLVFGGDIAAQLAPLAAPRQAAWEAPLALVSSRSAQAQVHLAVRQGATAVAELNQTLTLAAGQPAAIALPAKLTVAGRYSLDMRATAGDAVLYQQETEFMLPGVLQLAVYGAAFGDHADVVLQASGPLTQRDDLTAILTLQGPGPGTAPVQLPVRHGMARIRLPLPAAPGQYLLLASLRAGQEELGRAAETFEKKPVPEYFRTRAGLTDKVLEPFTPLQARGSSFSCWGRNYDFGGGPFPVRITTRDQQVLAAPVKLVGRVDGKPIIWKMSPGKLRQATPTEARYESAASAAGVKLTARTLVEYDGCVTTDLTVDAAGHRVEALALEVPLKPERAKYIHSANASWSDSVSHGIDGPGWKWERAFVPYVWLGDEARGLAWFAETDEPFALTDRNRAVQVLADKDRVLLRINMVDHAVQLPEPLRWRFGLQATPVKPVPRRLPHLWHGAYYGMETQPYVVQQSLTYPALGNLDPRQGTLEAVVTVDFDPEQASANKQNHAFLTMKLDNGNMVSWFWDYVGKGMWFYVGLGASYPQQYPVHISANNLDWHRGETHHLALTWGDKTRMYMDGKLAAESVPHEGWLTDSLEGVPLHLGGFSTDPSGFVLHELRVAEAPASPADLAARAAQVLQQGARGELSDTPDTLLLDHFASLAPNGQPLPAAKFSAAGKVRGGQLSRPGLMKSDGLMLGGVSETMTVLDYLKSKGVEVVVYHDTWTEAYGQPTTIWGDKLRSLIEAVHQHGMKLIVYFGYGLAGTTPQMQIYHDQWAVLPLIPWSGGAPQRTFDAGCNRSPLMEFMLDGIGKLAHDYDLDGIYMDGTTEPFGCVNSQHGCGYQRDGQWIKTYPIWRNHEFMRRMYTIFRQQRPGTLLDQHMSGNMIIPELSFCDSYWDGEQFEGYKFGAQKALELLPLDKFRAEFMGKQWGLRAEFLNYEKRPFTMPESLSFVLLHDMYVRASGLGEHLDLVSAVWKAFDDFGTDQAAWLPYWEQKAALPQQAGTYCSAYVRPDSGALLVVSNLTGQPVTAHVKLDRRQLHLGPQVTTAREARTGQPFAINGDMLQVELGAMECALVRLGK